MLQQPTIEKLHALRLAPMADAWGAQQRDPSLQSLTFDERFSMIVDAEYIARDNRKLARLLKEASLRIPHACVEDVDTQPERGLEKQMVRQLATCAWISDHLNVLLTGPTGVGKSYVASALGLAACRKGIRTAYKRLPRLLDELALARATGAYANTLAKYARADLLILDDWGLGALLDSQRHDLLELIEDRYETLSTVITSQLPIAKWHQWIGDPTVADALLDRIVHNAYKIDLKGNSKRKENHKNPKT